jgi:molybdate transport system substrate-binding protein
MGVLGRITAVALLAVLLGAVPAVGSRAEDRVLLVFAAASMKNALDAAAADFTEDANAPVTISYAASPTLAKQIEAGAPADIFISADLDWMDYLDERRLIKANTRRSLVGNTLVLIAPAKAPVELAIGPAFPIAEKLGDGRLAMANTKAVPAGKYAKAALETLRVWPAVEGKLAEADNVRAALSLVSRGEAPLGIVYASDAAADPGVVIVDAFPADTHPKIVYPVAVTADSTHPAAQSFVSFLASDAGRGHFEKEGFSILAGDAGN